MSKSHKKAKPLNSQPELQTLQPEVMAQPQPQFLQPPPNDAESSVRLENISAAEDAGASPDFESIEADLGANMPAADPAASGFLTKDQFFAGFGGCFTMASAVTGLQSLEISDKDKMAREASDAIYDTAIETPMFHFLVRPGNIYVQRSLVILVFAKTKADAVKLEAAEKRAATRRPVASSQPQAVPVSPASDPLSPDFGKGFN